MGKCVALLAIGLLFAVVATAESQEDDGFWTPRADYVRLLGQATLSAEHEAKAKLLEERLAIEQAKTTGLTELVAIERQKVEAHAELAQIQRERGDYWKQRVDEVDKHARRDLRKANTVAGCASGALAGSFVMPGPGTLAGFAIGCAVGFFELLP